MACGRHHRQCSKLNIANRILRVSVTFRRLAARASFGLVSLFAPAYLGILANKNAAYLKEARSARSP